MTRSSWSRAALKSVAWKVVGVVSLIFVSWFAGVSMIQIGKITLMYHVLTLILYIVHERIWNGVDWGKRPLEGKNENGYDHN